MLTTETYEQTEDWTIGRLDFWTIGVFFSFLRDWLLDILFRYCQKGVGWVERLKSLLFCSFTLELFTILICKLCEISETHLSMTAQPTLRDNESQQNTLLRRNHAHYFRVSGKELKENLRVLCLPREMPLFFYFKGVTLWWSKRFQVFPLPFLYRRDLRSATTGVRHGTSGWIEKKHKTSVSSVTLLAP